MDPKWSWFSNWFPGVFSILKYGSLLCFARLNRSTWTKGILEKQFDVCPVTFTSRLGTLYLVNRVYNYTIVQLGGGHNILLYLLYAADTQYIVVEHFPVLFSHLDGTRCSKTAYMLSPFSCSGQTYIPTVKEFNSYFFKWW